MRARAAALRLQGVRRLRRLRARATAIPLQGVRRLRRLRARAAATPLQGVRRLRHLRARAAATPMQGVRRLSHLRARGAAGWLPEMPCQARSCADLRSCSRTRGQESYLGAVRVVHPHIADMLSTHETRHIRARHVDTQVTPPPEAQRERSAPLRERRGRVSSTVGIPRGDGHAHGTGRAIRESRSVSRAWGEEI